MLSRVSIGRCFVVMTILGRVGYFIVTPLWLDFFKTHTNNETSNGSVTMATPTSAPASNDSSRLSEGTNMFFVVAVQWGIGTIFFGVLLLVIVLATPHLITDVDRNYPKKQFFVIGFAQGVSSVLANYAISGTRTSLYLQAVLTNFNIPIQFTVRFFLLRKWPSRLKLFCAVAVALAEFVCLLPSIVPGLESKADHENDGGATGPGAILWPLCLVSSMVPFAVANSVMERNVQRGSRTDGARTGGSVSTQPTALNLIFFLFWLNLFVFLIVLVLFWVDIIPGFGTSANMADFGKSLAFNARCVFGSGCPVTATTLAWTTFLICIMASFAFAGVMRYTEGANFVIIALTLRTPILFLFWTLFKEPPFHWHPETDLSTWLSLGAICVMLPAIIIYDRAPPEKSSQATVSAERQALLDDNQADNDENYGTAPTTPSIQTQYRTTTTDLQRRSV